MGTTRTRSQAPNHAPLRDPKKIEKNFPEENHLEILSVDTMDSSARFREQLRHEKFVLIKPNEMFLDHKILSAHTQLTEDLIRLYQNDVHWWYISGFRTLSEPFISAFQDQVHWPMICRFQRLSEDFLDRFAHRVSWVYTSGKQRLSEAFIERHQNDVCWVAVSCAQLLSETFIRRFHERVSWGAISRFQTLSESFIREFQDRVFWLAISRYQDLSDSFIHEFRRNLHFNELVPRLSIMAMRPVKMALISCNSDRLLDRLRQHHTRVRFALDWLLVWIVCQQTLP